MASALCSRGVTVKPSRASRIAGWNSAAHGKLPVAPVRQRHQPQIAGHADAVPPGNACMKRQRLAVGAVEPVRVGGGGRRFAAVDRRERAGLGVADRRRSCRRRCPSFAARPRSARASSRSPRRSALPPWRRISRRRPPRLGGRGGRRRADRVASGLRGAWRERRARSGERRPEAAGAAAKPSEQAGA